MKAKKKYGQNFLVDKSIISKIIACVPATSDDLIIEIGPGRGALTTGLQKTGAKIICYEIDMDMTKYLSSLENDRVQIKYQDILESDIKNDIKNIKYNKIYVVGNLPYYITTAIIKHLINENLDASSMIFMVQEEVAARFVSLPGTREYGGITLYLKYYFELSKEFKVSKNCFNPIPKVESAIIKLEKRNNRPLVDEAKYFQLITDAFKMKRKTLKNNLVGYNFELIEHILNKHGISTSVRAEELSEEIFVEIANVI